MKYLLLALFLMSTPTMVEPAKSHRFVVIFDYQPEPTINMRYVILADSEGEAVMKATVDVLRRFGNNLEVNNLKFVEVAKKE